MEEYFTIFNTIEERLKQSELEDQRTIDALEEDNRILEQEKCDITNKLRRYEELSKERVPIISALYKMNGLDVKTEAPNNNNAASNKVEVNREKLARKLNAANSTPSQNQKLLEPVRSSADLIRGQTVTATGFNTSLDEYIPFSSASEDKHTSLKSSAVVELAPARSSSVDIVKRATVNAIRRTKVANPCILFQTGSCVAGDACRQSHDVIPSRYCKEYNNTGNCSDMACCKLRHELYEYRPVGK